MQNRYTEQNVSAATDVVCQHTDRLNFLCWRWFVPKCSCDYKAASNKNVDIKFSAHDTFLE